MSASSDFACMTFLEDGRVERESRSRAEQAEVSDDSNGRSSKITRGGWLGSRCRVTMYGDIGNKLVEQAKREQSLPDLLPYEAESVRAIVREVRDLAREVAALITEAGGTISQSQDPARACSLLIDYLGMRRNKRCLLAYHRIRTDKLDRLVWSGDDISATEANARTNRQSNGTSADNESSLSPEEEEYVRLYSDLLSAYKGQWTDIDLTGSLEPPRDLFIDVRVLKDAGEIQTEYGAINLTKNSQFYVRQGDVERLIQQGYLQKLS